MCLTVASVLTEKDGQEVKEGRRGSIFEYSELKMVSMKDYEIKKNVSNYAF